MNYCQYCGAPLAYQADFCSKCGKPVAQVVLDEGKLLVEKLSSRLKTNGIIWIVIAAIQLVIGVCGAWWTLVTGVLNLISAIGDLRSSKRIRSNPNGIVASYRPIAGSIVNLVYNVVAGGVIGVLGSIYYLVFVRGFVMENESRFLALEAPVTPAAQAKNAARDESAVDETLVITAQEAQQGTQKELFLTEVQKAIIFTVPKRVSDGQIFRLRNVQVTNQEGKSVKRDFYIRVRIQPSDAE